MALDRTLCPADMTLEEDLIEILSSMNQNLYVIARELKALNSKNKKRKGK